MGTLSCGFKNVTPWWQGQPSHDGVFTHKVYWQIKDMPKERSRMEKMEMQPPVHHLM